MNKDIKTEVARVKNWLLGLDSVPWEEEVHEEFKELERLSQGGWK